VVFHRAFAGSKPRGTYDYRVLGGGVRPGKGLLVKRGPIVNVLGPRFSELVQDLPGLLDREIAANQSELKKNLAQQVALFQDGKLLTQGSSL
jgi:hypothetical protein